MPATIGGEAEVIEVEAPEMGETEELNADSEAMEGSEQPNGKKTEREAPGELNT